jgi:DnaJ-class molecular chaperone
MRKLQREHVNRGPFSLVRGGASIEHLEDREPVGHVCRPCSGKGYNARPCSQCSGYGRWLTPKMQYQHCNKCEEGRVKEQCKDCGGTGRIRPAKKTVL